MKLKKSQMELMGLAIVVILISLAMLFVIRFMVLQKPVEYKKEFTQSQLASNMINTLLKTTNPDCHDLTFTELYQDCARNPYNPSVNCNLTHDSCEYLNASVTTILTETLIERSIAFEYVAEVRGSSSYPPIDPIYKDVCTRGFKSKQFPIPVDPSGTTILFVTLNICE